MGGCLCDWGYSARGCASRAVRGTAGPRGGRKGGGKRTPGEGPPQLQAVAGCPQWGPSPAGGGLGCRWRRRQMLGSSPPPDPTWDPRLSTPLCTFCVVNCCPLPPCCCFVQVFLGRLRDSEVERINDKISQVQGPGPALPAPPPPDGWLVALPHPACLLLAAGDRQDLGGDGHSPLTDPPCSSSPRGETRPRVNGFMGVSKDSVAKDSVSKNLPHE